jgi:hypothetical protein
MSGNNEQELEQLEMSIEMARKKVTLGEAITQLQRNPYFKMLILDEYLKNYTVHLVMNKASYGMQGDKDQKFINDQLIGIGHLDQFLRYTAQEGREAAAAIKVDEETRSEIMGEA